MKVKFNASLDDFVAAGKRLKAYSTYNKKFLSFCAVLAGAAAGIVTYLIFGNWGAVLCSIVGGFCSVFLINPDPLARTLKKSYRKTYGIKEPVETEMEISGAGIAYRQFDKRAVFQWSEVEKIEETDRMIYFHTQPDYVIFVPKRSFASDAEKAGFVKLAEGFLNKTRTDYE
jgi:hypothetical protein